MDSSNTSIILIAYGIIGVSFAIILLYLIIRRIKIKKEETFEKRDY